MIDITRLGPAALLDAIPRHRRLWRAHDKRRLAAAIIEMQRHYAIAARPVQLPPPNAIGEGLPIEAEGPLSDAAAALVDGDIDSGWKFLQQLEREMVPTLDADQLDVRLTSALTEAEFKLSQWRNEAARALANGTVKTRQEAEDRPTPPPAPRDGAETAGNELAEMRRKQRVLQEVLFHLHTHHQNVYHKLGKLRRQAQAAGAGVLISLVVVMVLNWFDFFGALAEDIQFSVWLAVLSGTLGGVLSVAYTVTRTDQQKRIPELSADFVVMLARPLVGGAIALPILFFIESGLLTVEPKKWWVPALCFLGGFSERWFLGLVEGFSNRGAASEGEKAR